MTALLPAEEPIPGIGPKGKIVVVTNDCTFTEGPAVDAEGNVYFTDIPNNRIHKIDLDGKMSVFLEDSKRCNGLMVDAKGRLIACQGGEGRIVAIDVRTKELTVLADKYDGKRFNQPNDLVVDRQGGVYFTDPIFGKAERAQDKLAVYYANEGKVTRLIDDVPLPNGVILSPDEKTLYVLSSGQAEVMAYPVESPGKLGKGKVLCKLQQPDMAERVAGGDGLTIDTKGNLYLTVPQAKLIQVVDPEGKTLGVLRLEKSPANCAFGGKDMQTLYVTARETVYAIPMEAVGHRFPGGAK
jgi:gluconolactonase